MKLGLWNRLAIVATVLALLVAPIAIMMDMYSDISALTKSIYEACITSASDGPGGTIEDVIGRCNSDLSAGLKNASDAAYSWNNWFSLTAGTLVVSAFIYALIWIASSVVRWVLRGRH